MDGASLREGLLSAESPSPELRARHDREVTMLLEQGLSKAQRWSWGVTAVLGVLFGVASLGVAVMLPNPLRQVPESTQWLARAWFAVFGAGGLGWAMLARRIVVRGSFHRAVDGNAITALMWLVMVGAMTLAMLLGGLSHDPVRGLAFVFQAFVFLTLFGVVPMITNQVQQSSLQMREHLLRLELQLAELREAQSGA